jgi:RTX calcium-binding nonapeptide repeat (4 copies)
MTVITSSHVTTGPAAFYDVGGFQLNLPAGNFLVAEDFDALYLSGTSETYDVFIDGMIHGSSDPLAAGIRVGDTVSGSINVSNTGVVAGGLGIEAYGVVNITNSGSIIGMINTAISQFGGGDFTIRNLGSIQGYDAGIGFALAALGVHTIINEGLIATNPNSVFGAAIFNQQGNDSQTLIANEGTIKGDILLQGGADSVTTTDGKIIGLIELGDGDDQFHGGRRAEHVVGGADADFLDGGLGSDTLEGGAGDDVYTIDSQGDIVVDAEGDTADVVQTSVEYILPENVEIEFMIALGTGDIGLMGNAISATTMSGNEGNNVLTSNHDDGLVDILQGFGGNDLFILGADLLDQVSDTQGIDTISSTVSRDLGLYAGVENIEIIGNLKADLVGTGAANSLVGNSNKNEIDGFGGNDFIIGDLGKDVLSGGTGKDLFLFRSTEDSGPSAALRDTITDFKSRADTIDLFDIDAIKGGGDNAFTLLARGTQSSAVGKGEIGYFWVDNAGVGDDKTVLRLNVDSDADMEMSIELNGLITLRAEDFAL